MNPMSLSLLFVILNLNFVRKINVSVSELVSCEAWWLPSINVQLS